MLMMLLHSHPDILAHGEVLDYESIGYLGGRYGTMRRQNPAMSSRLQRYRQQHPEAFLYDVVFNADGHKSVGFKFNTDEVFWSSRRFTEFNKLIVHDDDIKSVRLTRSDVLAHPISFLVKQQTGVMLVRDDNELPAIRPFAVNPRRALAYVADVRRLDRLADKAYANHRTIALCYEDLILLDHPVRADLLRFVEVPSAELTSATRKIVIRPDEIVTNFDEVQRLIAASDR
jgi:hypothetical protein